MSADPSFELFVRRSATPLLRVAVLLCGGDRAAAEDLVQQTLVRVARRWGDGASQAPEAYARVVLVNLSRDAARRAGRRVVEVAWDGAELASPLHADHADAVAVRDEVIAALGLLHEHQREVLVLRFYADLSVADTAAAIGASEGTVKSTTSRALARMRELLEQPAPAGAAEVSHDR